MSYDDLQLVNEIKIWLKGHQIIGELRLLLKTQILHLLRIEGSPDHWWVTTHIFVCFDRIFLLKGHQIIGELRRCYRLFVRATRQLKGHQIIGELRQLETESEPFD